MRDLVKRYVDAGRDAVGEERVERVEDLARDLFDWSRRNAERLTGLVRREVQRQLRLAGGATREEVSELRKRVRVLERQLGVTPGKRAGAKKTASRKPSGKKTSATKATPRKGSGRKAAGRKAAGRKAGARKTSSRVSPE
jgi:hypothetical protein